LPEGLPNSFSESSPKTCIETPPENSPEHFPKIYETKVKGIPFSFFSDIFGNFSGEFSEGVPIHVLGELSEKLLGKPSGKASEKTTIIF